jgi:predicted nucleotidyltransferase
MTRNELTYKVKESIRSIDPKAKIILFGSRARGDNNKQSDWDFLILTSSQVDDGKKKEIRNKLIDTELEAEEVISTLIFSQTRWQDYVVTPLYQNVIRDGIEL